MIVPGVVLVSLAILAAMFLYLHKKSSRKAIFGSAVKLGFFIGVVRAIVACIGWYGVAQTGGFLQIPAFFMAMFAWPEAWLVRGGRNSLSPEFYLRLSGLLIIGSMLVVGAVAAVADFVSSRRGA